MIYSVLGVDNGLLRIVRLGQRRGIRIQRSENGLQFTLRRGKLLRISIQRGLNIFPVAFGDFGKPRTIVSIGLQRCQRVANSLTNSGDLIEGIKPVIGIGLRAYDLQQIL